MNETSPFCTFCPAQGLVEVRLDPFHRCDDWGCAVQEFVLNLDWWPVTDLTVGPAMVETVDIFGRRDFKVDGAPPGSFAAYQFGSEQRVECLRKGIIPTVALGPDRVNSLGISKTDGVSNGSILTPAVSVINQLGQVPAGRRLVQVPIFNASTAASVCKLVDSFANRGRGRRTYR